MSIFRGLSAFPLTPVDAAGGVDADLLARTLERIAAAGADSIGLLGSTGGYAYLTREQRRRTVRIAVEAVGGRVPLVVGVGALRTDEAEALARDARETGADGLLLAPLSYLPLTSDEVFEHTRSVAAAGGLPLCLYNNPTTTRFTFGDDLIARLSTVPNVLAIKMPPAAGNARVELGRLRAIVPEGFAIGYSGDWSAADALREGADAWYSVVAGLLPEPAVALVTAARAGDAAKVEALDTAFQPLWTLFQTHGSFRVMYALADCLGVPHGVPPKPILPLGPALSAAVRDALAGVRAGRGPH